MNSIYIAVPTLSDSELFSTLKEALELSSGRNEIHIGVAGVFYGRETSEAIDVASFCRR